MNLFYCFGLFGVVQATAAKDVDEKSKSQFPKVAVGNEFLRKLHSTSIAIA